jgi:hypothetical protein
VCNYTYYKSLQLTSKLQQQLVWQQQQSQQAQTQPQAAASTNGQAGAAAAAAYEHGWPCFSLFVHMPSFEVVSQPRQREFVMHLLDLVAKWVAGGQGEQAVVQQQQGEQAVVMATE